MNQNQVGVLGSQTALKDAATKAKADALSKEIIGAAIEVHSALGPGLLESAYLISLCHELTLRKNPISTRTCIALQI
jgi:hypothetical protein